MKTMRDVADRAGVSATTVSFVLNGRQPTGGPISAETQQRVLDAAKELGYRRNALVQAVVSGRNRALGFLSSSFEHEFVSRVLGGALDAAEKAGYTLQILRLKNNMVDRAAIERCFEMRLAGLLTLDMEPDALEYLNREMKPHRIPVAFIDTSFQRTWGTHIATDDLRGCEMAIDHLVELGHRRIAFVSGPANRGMAAMRERGYRLAMKKHGLEIHPTDVVYAEWSMHKAEELAYQFLAPPSTPTAVLCANDTLAVGVQRAARRRGLQLPAQLSIIGFADSEMSLVASPSLTSVGQPMSALGVSAVEAILGKLIQAQSAEAWEDSPQEKLLPTYLIVRDSTAPPP